MIKLNKNLEYALMALKFMQSQASEGEKVTVKNLSTDLGVPFDPLSRVMQRLVRSKIIISEQGVSGGYHLNLDLKEVSLDDIITSLQGPLEIVKCLSNSSDCSMHENCDIKSPVSFLNQKLKDFYKEITISELLQIKDITKVTTTQEALA